MFPLFATIEPFKNTFSEYNPYPVIGTGMVTSTIPSRFPNLTFWTAAVFQSENDDTPSTISMNGASESSDVIYTAPCLVVSDALPNRTNSTSTNLPIVSTYASVWDRLAVNVVRFGTSLTIIFNWYNPFPVNRCARIKSLVKNPWFVSVSVVNA